MDHYYWSISYLSRDIVWLPHMLLDKDSRQNTGEFQGVSSLEVRLEIVVIESTSDWLTSQMDRIRKRRINGLFS